MRVRNSLRSLVVVTAVSLSLVLSSCGSDTGARQAGAAESSPTTAVESVAPASPDTSVASPEGAVEEAAVDEAAADETTSEVASSQMPAALSAAAPGKPANGTWPDVNAADVGDNAVNPRFCVENATTVNFETSGFGLLGPGAMVCKLVAKQEQSNPKVEMTVTQQGNPRNLFCLSAEDYKIGRPTIHVTPSWGAWDNNSCVWDSKLDFALGENAKSDKSFLYPFQFQGFRGADETGAMPSKTLILRITNDEQWPDVNGAEIKKYRSNPRVCIDNKTDARFETDWKAVIKPNSMACFLTKTAAPMPVIAVKFYEAGVINNGYCIEGQDYIIGRPDITLFGTTYPKGKPECGKELKQFDLGENTVSKDYFSYPYHFTASRGADQSVAGPSKTLVLHISP